MIRPIAWNSLDLIGETFGRLMVVDRVGRDSQGYAVWLCICECGNPKRASTHDLRKGTTRSCGCLLKDRPQNRRRALYLVKGRAA